MSISHSMFPWYAPSYNDAGIRSYPPLPIYTTHDPNPQSTMKAMDQAVHGSKTDLVSPLCFILYFAINLQIRLMLQ